MQYVVDVGWVRDCYGYTACTFGEITGSARRLPLTGSAVRLANGSTAYFTDFTCGASCGESTLVWRAGSAYYEVGVRAGRRSTLVAIANSMTTYAHANTPAYFQFVTNPGEKPSIVEIADPATIDEARLLIARHKSKILSGIIATKPAPYNPLYRFHFVPNTVRFADFTTEVCDATATYVEQHLHEVGGDFLPGNRWCPWHTRLMREVRPQ
jgi:hypothetical protein